MDDSYEQSLNKNMDDMIYRQLFLAKIIYVWLENSGVMDEGDQGAQSWGNAN